MSDPHFGERFLQAPPVKRLVHTYGINLETQKFYFIQWKEEKGDWGFDKTVPGNCLAGYTTRDGVVYETSRTQQCSVSGTNKYCSGDGTVPYDSLSYCLKWKDLIPELTVNEIEHVEHRDTISSSELFLKLIEVICTKNTAFDTKSERFSNTLQTASFTETEESASLPLQTTDFTQNGRPLPPLPLQTTNFTQTGESLPPLDFTQTGQTLPPLPLQTYDFTQTEGPLLPQATCTEQPSFLPLHSSILKPPEQPTLAPALQPSQSCEFNHTQPLFLPSTNQPDQVSEPTPSVPSLQPSQSCEFNHAQPLFLPSNETLQPQPNQNNEGHTITPLIMQHPLTQPQVSLRSMDPSTHTSIPPQLPPRENVIPHFYSLPTLPPQLPSKSAQFPPPELPPRDHHQVQQPKSPRLPPSQSQFPPQLPPQLPPRDHYPIPQSSHLSWPSLYSSLPR
eukprot:TRINITY_DN6826_c0_g1_i1.p1 TRINITY_DN6826_c0_g1~~TRINITY_DN6826_c0_g1_i1.p1  ORF type:complete len:448 (+),score=93.58 TRINITY_DN6826_c0_g1_i1:908-2251(+)